MPYSQYGTGVAVDNLSYPYSGGHQSAREHHIVIHAPYFNPVAYVQYPVAPVVVTPVIPQVSVLPVAQPPLDLDLDPAKRPAKVSSVAERLKSLEYQSRGDEQLRKKQWAQAYMRYRSALDAAGDRGEARFRQAFTYTAIKQYSSAIREFKRGLFLDPELPVTGISLAELFGSDSEIIRTSILHKVADWVKEDPQDAERLFLLGLLLHFEGDPRSRDVFQSARVVSAGDNWHIDAMLNANRPAADADPQIKPALLPDLPPLPKSALAPNPIPGNLALHPEADPVNPPLLPVLSDRPMPPVVRVTP